MTGKGKTQRFHRHHSPEERFWGQVEKTETCWLWTGKWTNGKAGHGRFKVNGKGVVASRFSWELHNGSIPDDLFVLHKCDVPACVNPDHLFLGTLSDNAQDMWDKGKKCYKGQLHPQAVLNESQVKEIRERYRTGLGPSLAKEFGVTDSAILSIVKRKTWAHLT